MAIQRLCHYRPDFFLRDQPFGHRTPPLARGLRSLFPAIRNSQAVTGHLLSCLLGRSPAASNELAALAGSYSIDGRPFPAPLTGAARPGDSLGLYFYLHDPDI